MLLTIHGHCTRPAVVTMGTWDPFLRPSADFLRILVSYAHRRDRDAIPVVLDPTPAAIVNGRATWPYYQDVASRVAMLRACGADAVAVIGFARPDLDVGACELFDLLATEMTLAEFWLRNKQSVGSGAKGSATVVRTQCEARGITLRFMKRFMFDLGVDTRRCLQAGSVAQAAAVAGAYPTLRRPDDGVAETAWRPGRYRAVPLDALDAFPEPIDAAARAGALPVELVPTADGMAAFRWPDAAVPFLRFVEGPADAAADATDAAALVLAGDVAAGAAASVAEAAVA